MGERLARGRGAAWPPAQLGAASRAALMAIDNDRTFVESDWLRNMQLA